MPWWGWLLVWEGGWWVRRLWRRKAVFARARAVADRLGKPLVVVGAPGGGVTAGYSCGDFTIDIDAKAVSACPNYYVFDLNKDRLPFQNDSVVVFQSCTLEYVRELDYALGELRRVSGGLLFGVNVEPWTAVGSGITYAAQKYNTVPDSIYTGEAEAARRGALV
jgi:hypothetical protein